MPDREILGAFSLQSEAPSQAFAMPHGTLLGKKLDENSKLSSGTDSTHLWTSRKLSRG